MNYGHIMEKFSSFYTISLNSSIDYSFSLEEIVYDDINRIKESRVDAGGKGLNVARMLTGLDCRCTALAFIGGENGEKLKSLLREEKVNFRQVRIEGNVRNVFNFFSGEKVLRFNEPGPRISSREKERLFGLVDSIRFKKGDVLSISGSLPPGLSKSTYREIIENVRIKGVYTVFDADGEALSEGIRALPDVVKPNLWELERIAGRRIDSQSALEKELENLMDKGISTVLLTLGKKGALLFSGNCGFYASVPQVKVKSTVGCGDAFLAGFLCAISLRKTEEECLKWAAASGTAKACLEGTLMPGKNEIQKMLKRIKVKRVKKSGLSFLFRD